jgi:IS5 family transposase
MINWKIFRPILDEVIPRETGNKGGRPPYDNLLMFKILILKTLYNLSIDNIEYQITDRASFKRFLGLKVCSKIPDSRTIWLYEDLLSKSNAGKQLFDKFSEVISSNGYITKTGSIVDATFVEAPRRKNNKEQNEKLKEGNIPEEWVDKDHPQKLLQRDCDATWTKKGDKSYFGYKDHIKVDNESKLIIDYNISTASTNDLKGCEKLFNKDDRVAYGDKAYSHLKLPDGVLNMVYEKAERGHPLTEYQIESNRIKSKTRSRIEHIFGMMSKMFNGLTIRCKRLARATFNISLLNLLYNIRRFITLKRLDFKGVMG